MKNLVKVFVANGKIFSLENSKQVKTNRSLNTADGDIFFLVKKKRLLDPIAGDSILFAGKTLKLTQDCTINGWLTLPEGEKVRLSAVEVLNPRFEHFLDIPYKDEVATLVKLEVENFIKVNGFIGVFFKAYSFLKDIMLFLSHPFNGNVNERIG